MFTSASKSCLTFSTGPIRHATWSFVSPLELHFSLVGVVDESKVVALEDTLLQIDGLRLRTFLLPLPRLLNGLSTEGDGGTKLSLVNFRVEGFNFSDFLFG